MGGPTAGDGNHSSKRKINCSKQLACPPRVLTHEEPALAEVAAKGFHGGAAVRVHPLPWRDATARGTRGAARTAHRARRRPGADDGPPPRPRARPPCDRRCRCRRPARRRARPRGGHDGVRAPAARRAHRCGEDAPRRARRGSGSTRGRHRRSVRGVRWGDRRRTAACAPHCSSLRALCRCAAAVSLAGHAPKGGGGAQ